MLLKRLVANPSLLLIPSISVQSNARNIEILWDKMLRRIKWFALTLTIDDLHSNAIFLTVIIPYSIRVRCKAESLAKSKSCLNDNFQWVWITANLISEPLSLSSGDLCLRHWIACQSSTMAAAATATTSEAEIPAEGWRKETLPFSLFRDQLPIFFRWTTKERKLKASVRKSSFWLGRIPFFSMRDISHSFFLEAGVALAAIAEYSLSISTGSAGSSNFGP